VNNVDIPAIPQRDIDEFCNKIWCHYEHEQRPLPWRETDDAYRILVSEIMLQQTQVSRVVPKYTEFLDAFPTIQTLACAPLADVLKIWRGLGYNRRALSLKSAAEKIVSLYQGVVPSDVEQLRQLPGIGSYTAAAVAVFAYGQAVPLIETNIRRTYIHFFFADREQVRDREIMPVVEKTLDRSRPREWFYALMDYGAMLKSAVPNPNRRSAHHSVQSPFEGSRRQVRGAILRTLVDEPLSLMELAAVLKEDVEVTREIVVDLTKEGFLVQSDGMYRIK
jgi:A/G-specific adenine glycosylase